jgi:hypothetical protein
MFTIIEDELCAEELIYSRPKLTKVGKPEKLSRVMAREDPLDYPGTAVRANLLGL